MALSYFTGPLHRLSQWMESLSRRQWALVNGVLWFVIQSVLYYGLADYDLLTSTGLGLFGAIIFGGLHYFLYDHYQ